MDEETAWRVIDSVVEDKVAPLCLFEGENPMSDAEVSDWMVDTTNALVEMTRTF